MGLRAHLRPLAAAEKPITTYIAMYRKVAVAPFLQIQP
jgi:hypothetical protein